tara:strand:+ start:3715 stop:4113 length:399 start_codon:yes stop_codon:yes gene_type:complete
MNIKINIANLPAIQAAVNEANGRSTAHTFHAAAQIIQCAENAEKQLADLGLIKSLRPGAMAVATSGNAVARSYKYQRMISYAKMIRKSSAWFLIELSKFETWTTGAGITSINLTAAQDISVSAIFRSRYGKL